MDANTLILLLSVGRIALGLSPIVAAALTARLIGLPTEHDNPTARLMGRLFGVRDIGLGVVGLAAVYGDVPVTFALLFNAATDFADAFVIAIPLVRRQGIDRGAKTCLVLALGGCSAWLAVFAFI